MIKYIFFDLDETLFDFPLAERLAISETFAELGIMPTEENIKLYSKINRLCWDGLERGELTRDRLIILRFEMLFDELSIVGLSPRDAQRLYENALGAQHPFIEGAEEILSELCKKYELYAVTNGLYSVQSRRIKDAGLDRFFKGYFISEEIGYSKPDRRFFETAFEKISGFDKDNSIIIGDSLQSDILGGKNAEIRTCHYNPKSKVNKTEIIPDYEIKNLSEIPRLLKEI
ncbi:MAG: YjjG family noncanonical pyrimidine nucleotidase [Clostridia bacterium]|nr:YjjG family noncanonical pyrimidine nucleotidase [Clostridia bacterium]